MTAVPWAEVLAGRLLNGLPAGVAIALAAWMVLRLVGRKNSSTRFTGWFAALLAIGISPVLGGAASSELGRASAITVPGSWAAALLSVWAVIAGVGLVRVGIGLHGLRKLRKRHKTATVPEMEQAVREFGVSREVTLAISEEVRVPTAIGFWKPMIILPAWSVNELSPGELNAILIHELAHLKRYDDVTNLAQKVIKALLFFNPAVWWLENQLTLEREMACDDAVLAKTENPLVYAQCLVAVAERTFVRRGMALAQAAVSQIRQTSRRVVQILDGKHREGARVWKPMFAVMTVFTAACAVMLSRAPEVVGFRDAPAPMLASGAIEPVSHAMMVPASYKVLEKPTRPVGVHKKAVRPKAAGKLAQRNPQSMETVIFVVETRWTGADERPFIVQSNGSVMPSWTLCIWRVTIVKAPEIPPAVSAKSI